MEAYSQVLRHVIVTSWNQKIRNGVHSSSVNLFLQYCKQFNRRLSFSDNDHISSLTVNKFDQSKIIPKAKRIIPVKNSSAVELKYSDLKILKEAIPSIPEEGGSFVVPIEIQAEISNIFDEAAKKLYVPPLHARNLAAFANASLTLQNLIRLGVDLSLFDSMPGVPEMILKMDFEKDIKPYLLFFHHLNIPMEQWGDLITKNPLILQEDLENVQIRINYLESKKFTKEAIILIATKAPKVLSLTVEEIDAKLGLYQKEFKFTGDELRQLITKMPKLITIDFKTIKDHNFTLFHELCFPKEDIKKMVVKVPKLLIISLNAMKERFDFLQQVLLINHDKIVHFPTILTIRKFIIKQRHLFLKSLGRDQYDPTKPNYVSLQTLICVSDAEFCKNVAKTTLDRFNQFLKTL